VIKQQTRQQVTSRRGKKSPVLEQYNCSLSCSDVTPWASRPVCVCLLGRFEDLLWWVGSHGPTAEAFCLGKLVGLWSIGQACQNGVGQQSGDHLCLWISGLAGFRGMVEAEIMQTFAGMRGVALWRLCKPVQAWGVLPDRVEIMQACVGLMVQPSRDCACVDCWLGRPSGLGLVVITWVWGVWVWVNTALAGLRSRAGGSEIPRSAKQWLHEPMGWDLSCSTGYFFSIL
jgi:hypothetical protein